MTHTRLAAWLSITTLTDPCGALKPRLAGADTSPMTRTALLSLPLHELHRLADTALRDSAARHGWAAHRAATLPRWLLVEVVMAAQVRARAEATAPR